MGSLGSVRRRTLALGAVLIVVVTGLLVLRVADRAGADDDRCRQFAADSRDRAAEVSGSGPRVVVIGDSWSAGLGLTRAATSWPSRLPGAVHVAGFSGSGFSEHASTCPLVSFADRAPAAVLQGADLVVVEGGLNDYDQPDADIRTGFGRLMAELGDRRVVVVGPAAAPARVAAVPHLDRLLDDLTAAYRVPYVRTSGLDLPYLGDGLHLTSAGHAEFGDYVASRLSGLTWGQGPTAEGGRG